MEQGTVKWFNAERFWFLSNAKTGDEYSYISQAIQGRIQILARRTSSIFRREEGNRGPQAANVNKLNFKLNFEGSGNFYQVFFLFAYLNFPNTVNL